MVDTQKLKELKELLDSGALTQAEFDAEKQKLIHMPGAIGAVEMVSTSGHMLLTMQKPDGAKLGITMDLKGTDVVVVSVIPGSITESSGVLVGDVVKMINGEAVSSPDDAVQKLVAASGEIKLSIYRASAVSVAPIPAVPSGTFEMADIAAKLQQLGDMKNGGLLSDEEFATAKAKILAEPVPQPAVAVTPLSIDVVGTWMLPGHVYIGMGQNAPIYMSGNILTIAPDLTIESTDVITQGSCLCCYLGATPAGYAMTDKPMPMTVTGPCEFEASIWATGTNSFAIVDKDTLKMKNRLMMQSYTGNALTFKRVGSPAGAVHSVNMERD